MRDGRSVTNGLWLGRWSWRGRLALGLVLFDLTNELVSFFLRHLTATNHVLDEIASALKDESREAGGRIYYIFHRGGHLAARLEANFVSLGGHLRHGVLYVSATVTGATFGRERRDCCRGSHRGRRIFRRDLRRH